MTPGELDELIAECPRLYHLAERGAWPGIRHHGLLSTSALLDLYGINGKARHGIESERREGPVTITHPRLGCVTFRDQSPMSDASLRRVLPPYLSPQDWYEALNHKVFFWLSERRLRRLSTAKANREVETEVFVAETRRLIEAHHSRIWLTPINSGATKVFGQRRDLGLFKRIEDYDLAFWKRVRPRGERVVELCVDHGVPDFANFVVDRFVVVGNTRRDWSDAAVSRQVG